MPLGYIPDQELTQHIQQTVKQFANSFQPRPKKGRRQRNTSGGGSSAGTEDIRGFSYTEIPAAQGVLGGDITPGVGLVKLYAMPSGPAGTPWTFQDEPKTAENWMHGAVAKDKPLHLSKSRVTQDGTQIYRVDAEGCAPIPLEGSSSG